MKLKYKSENEITITRDDNGVPHIKASNKTDFYYGLGYVHAMDRGMQILLMRILGQGKASELLDSSDEMLGVDLFFRRMNWQKGIDEEISTLSDELTEGCEGYCSGINDYFSKSVPWEFKLVGYKPPPWTIADSILISRMTGYLTLAQSQAEIERLLVEMVQADVSKEKLEEIFPGLLSGLDVELLKKVKIFERIVPEGVKWGSVIPRMMGSNNWVISGKKTLSGKPIVAGDPHLETNRLPNVWSEIAFRAGDRYGIGATMPGIPAMVIGRTNDLAWGVTYSFMDAVDSWIEDCRDGMFRRGEDEWIPFTAREETIKRRGKKSVSTTFYENEHGLLDGDPNEKGYYLSTRWSTAEAGAASINSFHQMLDAANVKEGMEHLGRLEVSFNWGIADQEGNIGYQMSGLMPKRKDGANGFIPLKGWEEENDWSGYHSHTDLPRSYNPEEGYIATANNNMNHLGKVSPISVSQTEYRVERIKQFLSSKEKYTVEDCFELQRDIYSLQAESFMKILAPLLPETPQGEILKNWDYTYPAESEGAFLFEEFYKSLFQTVFGESGLGKETVTHLQSETGIFADFFMNFDAVFLSENSLWFNGKDRDEIFSVTAKEALNVKPQQWGTSREYSMTNMFFSGKLPKLFGFDGGPIKLRGGRATVQQGQVFQAAGRTTSFCPSFRMVTDLANDHLHTAIAGGPSDRRFSKWYQSGLDDWGNGKYKKLSI